ncbi:hypothetical protein [Thiocystis violacea]|uniref:hypothetical protein n=1 Tax=Thiocystis violacea TaxID=13725 RepID=UPI001903F5F8|nr:hypothetical protein [Thiocystis violacea]
MYDFAGVGDGFERATMGWRSGGVFIADPVADMAAMDAPQRIVMMFSFLPRRARFFTQDPSWAVEFFETQKNIQIMRLHDFRVMGLEFISLGRKKPKTPFIHEKKFPPSMGSGG